VLRANGQAAQSTGEVSTLERVTERVTGIEPALSAWEPEGAPGRPIYRELPLREPPDCTVIAVSSRAYGHVTGTISPWTSARGRSGRASTWREI
jgi:hypothetical protein